MNAKDKYLNLSVSYFKGKLTIEELVEKLKEFISIKAEKLEIPKDKRAILIANHPRGDESLSIPAELIAGLKGGNHRNFPSFWFPILRQALLMEALQDHRFLTIGYDIGWRDAMQEMHHLLINPVGNGRCKEIISRMINDNDCSLVIFPEGGVRNLEEFHTGFFYIACALDIEYLAVAKISPVLSLEGENDLKIVHTENISNLTHSVINFVDTQKERLR